MTNIGVLGRGGVGKALARLFSDNAHEVTLGVREPHGGPDALWAEAESLVAAQRAEPFVLATPYPALAEALPPLRSAPAGKVVVDATNPVAADWSPLPLEDGNSAAEEVARLLPDAHVVKAFNTVFADNMRPDRLTRPGGRVTCFVASDSDEAAERVAALAAAIGFGPVVTGALRHARRLELVAHLNIALLARSGMNTSAAFLYDRGEA